MRIKASPPGKRTREIWAFQTTSGVTNDLCERYLPQLRSQAGYGLAGYPSLWPEYSRTEIIHEIFPKLKEFKSRTLLTNEQHFLNLIGQIIRHKLADLKKALTAKKRPPPAKKQSLSVALELVGAEADSIVTVIEVSQAIGKLRGEDSRLGLIMELILFDGKRDAELAEDLCISLSMTKALKRKAFDRVRAILQAQK